jgi:hypothetical protein
VRYLNERRYLVSHFLITGFLHLLADRTSLKSSSGARFSAPGSSMSGYTGYTVEIELCNRCPEGREQVYGGFKGGRMRLHLVHLDHRSTACIVT